MAKNHRLHSRPKQNPTRAMSPPHTYILDADGGTGLSLATPTDEQDEDDICPVCESECTCDNRRTHPTPSSLPSHSSQPYAGLVNAGYQPVSSVTGPTTLKIKLTLPPSMQVKHHGGKTHSPNTPTASGVGLDVGSLSAKAAPSPFSVLGQPLAPGGGAYLVDANGNPIKKRGRPSKADLAARAAARAVEAGAKSADIGQSNVVESRPQMSRARNSQNSTTKKKAAGKKSRASRKRKAAAPWEVTSESESVADRDDPYETQSISFPTFISTISTSSYTSSDSDSDSDQDVPSPSQKPLSHEDLLDNIDERQARKRRNRNDWEIRPRQKSVGAEDEADVSDDASGEDEDDEDEQPDEDEEVEEDEQDPSVSEYSYAGVATGWTDEDEEINFDAELLFANLSDSSADMSDSDAGDVNGRIGSDTKMEIDADVNMDALSLTEAAAAGFFNELDVPESRGLESLLFGHESWEGTLMFGDSVKEGQGMLDLAFEESAAQLNLGTNTTPSMEDTDIVMLSSEEEEGMVVLDMEGGEEYMYDDSDGDTTEDEYVELDGVPTPRNLLVFKFPLSMSSSIDPQSTLSPVVKPDSRPRSLSLQEPVKPADILSGKVMPIDLVAALESVLPFEEPKSPTSASQTSGKAPEMGAFNSGAECTTKKVIVTPKTKDLPSPFPAIRRLRRRSTSCTGTKRSGSGSDILSMTSGDSRSSSFLSSYRRPYQPIFAAEFFGEPTEEIPPTDPLSLQDVLEDEFLETESSDHMDSEADAELKRHMKSLSRWDVIPMDVFRRTRSSTNAWLNGPTMTRGPQTSDGICYGSPAGGMMRESPFSSKTLWDSSAASTSRQKGKGKGTPNPLLQMSPVLLPMRDGNQTPTPNHKLHQARNDLQQQLFGHAQNVKSRKELRKEKKRNRKMGHAAAARQRQHFPNMKSRSSGSMQRSNMHSSSPVPPLSL